MDMIERLEEFRESNSLRPADMARLFNVRHQNYTNWVRRGSLPKRYIEPARSLLLQTEAEGQPRANVVPAPTLKGWIPLISWTKAGEWNEAIDIYEPGYGERVVPTVVRHSELTFALRVDGGSMTLPEGVQGRSFPHGMIIYVDPRAGAEIGDFVVARRIGTWQATFKKLASEEGRPVLVPLNPDRNQYPIIRDEFEIIGRVIDAGWGGV